MKYNPRIDEEMAALKGFTGVHPLAPADTVKGCREVLDTAGKYLCEITGMSDMTFQPAAGAHGEFTGVLLIKQYHDSRGDSKRKKIIVPDSAHGTNPATAAMCGFEVVNVSSDADGCVDLEALKAVLGEDTAGLMLTNPNTLGLFDENILEITRLVHEAGGLCYYDGANLNAVMDIVPGCVYCRPEIATVGLTEADAKEAGIPVKIGKCVMFSNARTLISGDGRSFMNCEQLFQQPALYSTFLLWMLSEIYDALPEIGDPDKPKLVFFFDEAHLLFNDAPKELLTKVEQVVRLIRSKGVGIFFITQNPTDIPDTVLSQLGNRVEHALYENARHRQ